MKFTFQRVTRFASLEIYFLMKKSLEGPSQGTLEPNLVLIGRYSHIEMMIRFAFWTREHTHFFGDQQVRKDHKKKFHTNRYNKKKKV